MRRSATSVSRAERRPNPRRKSTARTRPTPATIHPKGMRRPRTMPTTIRASASPIVKAGFPAGSVRKLRPQVEDDEPLLGHLTDGPGGALLRVARVLYAAVRHLVGAEGRRLVDRDAAEHESGGGLDGVVERRREDARLQAVPSRVGTLDSLVDRVDRVDDADRAEDLLAGDLRVVGNVAEHCRAQQLAFNPAPGEEAGARRL